MSSFTCLAAPDAWRAFGGLCLVVARSYEPLYSRVRWAPDASGANLSATDAPAKATFNPSPRVSIRHNLLSQPKLAVNSEPNPTCRVQRRRGSSPSLAISSPPRRSVTSPQYLFLPRTLLEVSLGGVWLGVSFLNPAH